MAYQCPVYNHEQYVSSDDDGNPESDNCISESDNCISESDNCISESDNCISESDKDHTESNKHHYQSQSDHSESSNNHSEMKNHILNSDNGQSNSEYSTEDEEEVQSDNDDIQEIDDKIDSVKGERNLNEEGDEKDTLPEITAYSHHRRKHGKKHSGRRTHRRQKLSRLKLPTRGFATISKPNTSGWKCGRKTRLVTLKRNGRMGRREYRIVEGEVKGTMPKNQKPTFLFNIIPIPISYNSANISIIKIQKIVNGCMWRKYKDFQEVVRREAGYANERLLFHGTPKAKEVLRYGFDERFASIHGMFGAGIYFARHAAKSNKYVFGLNTGCKKHHDPDCTICIRQMFLCRVTLGKAKRTSTPKSFAHAPPEYHSVEGTPGIVLQYPEHIVYRGEQAYPEYLITYKLQ